MLSITKQSADNLSKIKAIDSYVHQIQREKLDKEVYQLDMLVDALGNADIMQAIFHVALGTKFPVFSDHYHREALLKTLSAKPIPPAIMDLVNAAASKKEKAKILNSLKKVKAALAEAEKTYATAKRLVITPQSLPGIIVTAGMILRSAQGSGKPPQGLDFVKKLYYEKRELLNAQENYFDNGIRKPLLNLLDQVENNGHQLAINDIQQVLEAMSVEYKHFDTLLKQEIDQLTLRCKQLIDTMELAPDLTAELMTVLASDDVAAIKKAMMRLDSDQRHQLKEISLLCALLDDSQVTREHYEGSANELMKIYNHIKSQAMTAHYQKLQSAFKVTTNASERDRITQELVAIENTFDHTQGYRRMMYSNYYEGQLDKAIGRYHGKVIANFQQSALPALGSSDGLCYGFSYLFGEEFNSLPADVSFDECLSRLSGNYLTRKNNDPLTVSMEAYLQWDSQHDIPLKDIFYDSNNVHKAQTPNRGNKIKEKLLVTDRIKREHFCNAILDYSENNPCTYMLSLQSKTEGHAIGFARNQYGIWLHDSNFGLVYFDTRNQNAEEDCKAFLADHIATYYPGLQNSFSISNIGVAHKLRQGTDAVENLIADMKLLTREVYGEQIGDRENILDEAGLAIKKIYDPNRRKMPAEDELIQLKSHIQNIQDALQIPAECNDKIKIRQLVENCESSIRQLEEASIGLQKLPQVTHNPSVASLLATHFSITSNALTRTAKHYAKNIKSLASDFVGKFVEKLTQRQEISASKSKSQVNVAAQVDDNAETAINYHYHIHESTTDKVNRIFKNTQLQVVSKTFTDYMSRHVKHVNKDIAAQLKNLLKEISSVKSENEAEQMIAKIRFDKKLNPVVRSMIRKSFEDSQHSSNKPRIKK